MVEVVIKDQLTQTEMVQRHTFYQCCEAYICEESHSILEELCGHLFFVGHTHSGNYCLLENLNAVGIIVSLDDRGQGLHSTIKGNGA